MNVAFAEEPILRCWVAAHVAATAHLTLRESPAKDAARIEGAMADLSESGVRLGCSSAAAANVVTRFYKRTLPYEGDLSGFAMRKALAREAIRVILSHVILLPATDAHFVAAGKLWVKLFVKGAVDAFAEFANYLDAVLVLQPQQGIEVGRVLTSHGHLPYILRKQQWGGIPLSWTRIGEW